MIQWMALAEFKHPEDCYKFFRLRDLAEARKFLAEARKAPDCIYTHLMLVFHWELKENPNYEG